MSVDRDAGLKVTTLRIPLSHRERDKGEVIH